MHILARTARQLNKWIFRTAASMPPDLLGAACMCCQRISIMMDGWYNELDHLEETVRHCIVTRCLLSDAISA